jgi:DUF1680 family protein
MALCVEMLKLTGNALVADELELSTFNFIIGSHSATGRWVTYNTPMDGVRRASNQQIVFQSREGSPELNCCSVNAPRGFGLLSDWALLKDHEGLVLNYYGPSTLATRVKAGVKLTIAQQTEYPADGRITLRIRVTRATRFSLKLRIPQWSAKTRVRVNGEAVRGVEAGHYLSLERMWKSGDTVELRLDMSLHFWRGARECKGRTSIYRGPILLAYDQRYNLAHARTARLKVRTSNEWDPVPIRPVVPKIDARALTLRRVSWNDWLPPLLLVKCKAADGTAIHLCDFGSAGETGSPYASWLPVQHGPAAQEFTREHPLPTCR